MNMESILHVNFHKSTKTKTLFHNLLIVYSVVTHYIMIVIGQTICPTNNNYCKETAQKVRCFGFGSLNQVPLCCTATFNELIIDSNGTNISSVQANAFNQLCIQKLDLQNLQIQRIDVQGFGGLGSCLQILFLNGNQLTSIQTGTFSSLQNLLKLQLHSNKLIGISQGFFNGLTKLALLTLENNQIAFVQNQSFLPTTELTILRLQNNLIENLTKESFARLNKLDVLYLQNNSIKKLQNDTFNYLGNLIILNLSSNAIRILPNDLFASTKQINTIDLSRNLITSIIHFEDFGSLANLFLNDNLINEIPKGTFKNLNNLLTLNLENNQISNLSLNSLTGIPNVKDLQMQNNRITALPIGCFDLIGALENLDLSSNNIANLEKDPFNALRNLQKLNMGNNSLTHIRQDWFESLISGQLENLILNENKITLIDRYSFATTQQLKVLNLAGNNLTTDIIQGLFINCTNLQILILNSNPLRNIDEKTFSGINSLERLYLNKICLESLLIQNLPNLQELHLQDNLLTTLSSDIFLGLDGLSNIDLGYNYISSIESSIFSSSGLTILNLTHNQLSSVELAVWSSTATVDLSYNQITTLDNFPSFSKFYLTGNPISCSCSNLLRTNFPAFVDQDTTLCSQSSTLTNQILVVCYLANTTVCPQSEISLDLPTSTNCLIEIPRINYVRRCSLKMNSTVQTPKPQILNLLLSIKCDGLHVTWTVDQFNDISGYNITWQNEQTAGQITQNAAENTLIIPNKTLANVTVCVQVLMTKQSGDTLCNETASALVTCTGNEDEILYHSNDLTVLQIILYIVVPVIGFLILLIIIIIIIIVAVRCKKKNKLHKDVVTISTVKTTTDASHKKQSPPNTISKGTKDEYGNFMMYEQAVVSVDLVQNDNNMQD